MLHDYSVVNKWIFGFIFLIDIDYFHIVLYAFHLDGGKGGFRAFSPEITKVDLTYSF